MSRLGYWEQRPDFVSVFGFPHFRTFHQKTQKLEFSVTFHDFISLTWRFKVVFWNCNTPAIQKSSTLDTPSDYKRTNHDKQFLLRVSQAGIKRNKFKTELFFPFFCFLFSHCVAQTVRGRKNALFRCSRPTHYRMITSAHHLTSQRLKKPEKVDVLRLFSVF